MLHGRWTRTQPDTCVVEERNNGVCYRRAENREWTICRFVEGERASASRYSEPRCSHQRQLESSIGERCAWPGP